ncbi:uncharacterized protein LOC143856026 [Tasmannia lanceolata]|uniref:uncharacterized protein LOC143856026 n=1 Tax=Tasmannia lanceolata TaxID=3420 RepID=UPI0040639606
MSSNFRSEVAWSRDFGGDVHVNDVEEDNNGYSTEEASDDDFDEEGDDVDENVGEGDDVHKNVGAGDEELANVGDMLGNTMARNQMVVDDMVVGDDEFNEGNMGVEELKVGALFRNMNAHEMVRTNPGSVMYVCRSRDLWPNGDDTFGCLFFSFAPNIRAFNTIRPLVLVDGPHLRGKYRGILLAATGIDGNGGLFPLAFAVVEGESYESWLWFLLPFRHTMMSAKRNVIMIASNRMKGLPRTVAKALPGSYYSYCIRHMSANFYSTFKSQVLCRQFVRAAYALRSVFKDAVERIKEMNIEAYKWIEELPKKKWASVYFAGLKYNVLTTNAAKCFNAILKEARNLPIASLVDHIRWKVSGIFQSPQKLGHSWNTRLTGKAEEWFASACDSARRYTPYACTWIEFEVKSLTNADWVDLEKSTCTCGRFQTMGMPCGHAITAMGMNHLDPYLYCQEWFFADTYRNTYDGVVHPTLDRSQWPEPPSRFTLVLPPLIR